MAMMLHLKDGSTTRLEVSKDTWRYLGVFFDSALSSADHVSRYTAKALVTLQGFRMIGNSVCGLPPHLKACLVKGCIYPIMMYSIQMWGNLRRACPKFLMKKITKVQHFGVQWITGSFHTTPSAALLFIAGFTPANLLVKCMATYSLEHLT
jgi:hypothetical protein